MSRPPAALHGLARQVAALEACHGPPELPPVSDPLQGIPAENSVGHAALKRMIHESPDNARRALKKIPGLGDAGADHVLLRSRAMVTLAPESDALRVLLRLGYGSERGDDAARYRSVAKAVAPELKSEWRWLEKARSLLRSHGRELCRRAAPQCVACPLTASCRWFLSRRRPG